LKIVGICLVRNDDRFLDTVLRNVHCFCDELIIADDQSKDHTRLIAERWAQEHAHIHYHRIPDPTYSQALIAPFYGQDVWLFAVDGDEIYEAERLARLKQELKEGRFADCWQVLGKVLHCDAYDPSSQRAWGYLARPSRSMTKLYNFSHIRDWKGPHPERLHGGEILFKDERFRGVKDESESELPWDDAVFRCLHTVFIRRSSLQNESDISRPNIAEKSAFSILERVRYLAYRMVGKEPASRTKQLTYQRGPRVELPVHTFFDPTSPAS
jgi:glycosyltransferase involved in cell wall biosynthesis